MRKYGVPVAIILLIALDQLVKWWTVENIALDTVREFIPNVMSLSYLRNYGAAWSLLQNQQTFFAIMTVIVMSGAIWYLIKHLQGSWWMVVGLCLVIAGGWGILSTACDWAMWWICSTWILSISQSLMWRIPI
jgi:signal peptidase II